MASLVVPREYGYVLLTLAASAVQFAIMGIKVTKARTKAGVPYPFAYAEKSEANADVKKHLFNCYQRVHYNTLENFPIFISLLLAGGVGHPQIASVGGWIFLVGRMAYMIGYTTGDPDKRAWGVFGVVGQITMLGASISTIYSILCQ